MIYKDRSWNKDKDGYYKGNINGKDYRLHRYIWEQYNGPIPKGILIHHIDENITNNSIDNLKLINQEEHNKLHHIGHKFSEECKKKMSETKLELWKNDNKRKDKLSDIMKNNKYALGHNHTDETKEKIRQAHIGKKRSEETKQKISQKIKEYWANRKLLSS